MDHSLVRHGRLLVVALVFGLGARAIDAQRKTPKPAAGTRAPVAKTAPLPAPAPKVERPVPFKVGEILDYDVSWSIHLTAGTVTVTVQEKKPSFGSTAYYISAEGRPTPLVSKLYSLYYKVDTLLDVYTLLPQRGSVYSEENGRRRMKITRFDQASRKAEYEVQTATVVKRQLALPPYTQDVLSAICVLRAIPLKEGGKMTMPVSDNGAVNSVRVTIGAREQVKTRLGTIAAWHITPVIVDDKGVPVGRGLAVWISDDARRWPVKLEGELAVGRFVVTLRNVKP
jgi:hypothetical protein